MKLARVLICALAVNLSLPAAAQSNDCRGELTHFVELLGKLRQGDDVAADLRASAELLCAQCERCDTRSVAEYYATLEPDARRQGVAEEQRIGKLWNEVLSAGRAGTAGVQWSQLRARIVVDLRALIERVNVQPDFVPAARALSLIARLEVGRISEDAQLGGEQRANALDGAERDARAALALFDRAGLLTPRLEPDWLLARLAAARGEHGEARASFERVLSAAEHVGNDDFRENALCGLLALARDAGEVREQERVLERIAAFRDPRTNWPLAREWTARLIHDDHAARALEFLSNHKPRDDSHVIHRIEWDMLMGCALLRTGDTQSARPYLERIAQGPRPELAVLMLAELALYEHRAFEVVAMLDGAQKIAGFSLRGRGQAHAFLGEALLSDGDARRAELELSTALALANDWQQPSDTPEFTSEFSRGAAAGAAGSVIGEHLGLHTIALLAQANSQLGRSLEAVRVIEDAHARWLRRRNDDGESERLTTGDVTAWAAHFELGFVTWVVGADFTVVAHIASDSAGTPHVQCERIPRGRTALAEAARRLREAALAGNGPQLARLASDIQSALFPSSIAAHLRATAASAPPSSNMLESPRLLLIAHGLEEMPFEMLATAELCGRADVCALVLPGLPERTPGEAPPTASLAHWSLLGAPLDAHGTPALPGAQEELSALAELHPDAQVVSGAAFDREHARAALTQGNAVHIATHLLPTCDAEDAAFAPSSLLLSGGDRLCVHAVAELAPHSPLVVLSACATGGGSRVDAEGLQGMARAFLDSGTRNLLVTSWPVVDGAAAAYAVAFHRALATGASPSRAAEIARRELQGAGFAPADWAAFRLLGRD